MSEEKKLFITPNGDLPAFASNDTIHPETGQRFDAMNTGLTKREYFAAMAMQGLLAAGDAGNPQRVSEYSLEYADALLINLEKPTT